MVLPIRAALLLLMQLIMKLDWRGCRRATSAPQDLIIASEVRASIARYMSSGLWNRGVAFVSSRPKVAPDEPD